MSSSSKVWKPLVDVSIKQHRTLTKLSHNQPVKPTKEPTDVFQVKVPDENPDIPKRHVFQQLRSQNPNPIYTLEQASLPAQPMGMTKIHRYPTLVRNVSDMEYCIVGVNNEDTIITQFPCKTDYILVGGGLIGSATAYHLKKILSRAGDVLVLDKNPYSPHNCTALCNGLLSSQSKSRDVSRVANLSKELIRALKHDALFTPEDYAQIKYRPCTHLILWPEKEVSNVIQMMEVYNDDGLMIDSKFPAELETTFPWLKVSDSDVFLGTHGNQDEAIVDPVGLRNVYRTLAQAYGARFLMAEAIDFNTTRSLDDDLSEYSSGNMVVRNPTSGELRSIGFSSTLLSLGHNTPFLESRAENDFAVKSNYGDLHFVQPKLRIQFTFYSFAAPTINFPVITDTDGSVLIRDDFAGDFKYCLSYEESDTFNDLDIQLMDLDSDDPYKNYYHKNEIFESYFETKIKPRLVKRIPVMEDAKFIVASSGHESYNCHDGAPIFGPHPFHARLLMSLGYGSKMVSFAPTIAAAAAELMIGGEEELLDMTPFYWMRTIKGRRIDEFDLLKR